MNCYKKWNAGDKWCLLKGPLSHTQLSSSYQENHEHYTLQYLLLPNTAICKEQCDIWNVWSDVCTGFWEGSLVLITLFSVTWSGPVLGSTGLPKVRYMSKEWGAGAVSWGGEDHWNTSGLKYNLKNVQRKKLFPWLSQVKEEVLDLNCSKQDLGIIRCL